MKANLCTVALAALAAGLTAVAFAAEPIVLKPSPVLAPGLDAFPRLVETPGSRAAKRINRALAQGDARVQEAARECHLGAEEAAARDGRPVGGEDGDWSRTITVTMRGPRYLSLLATDGWFCGGAHPDNSMVALVYDLGTGAPVNWKRLLPAALAQDTTTDTAGDGTVLGEVISPSLHTLYVQAVKAQPIDPEWDQQCADVLANSTLSFLLWPNAEANGIVVQPANLPHVVTACAESIVIATPELRKLGVDAELVDRRGAPAGLVRQGAEVARRSWRSASRQLRDHALLRSRANGISNGFKPGSRHQRGALLESGEESAKIRRGICKSLFTPKRV